MFSTEYCHFVMGEYRILRISRVFCFAIKGLSFYPDIQVISYYSPYYPTDNMREIRYIVLNEEPFQNLLADEDDGNKDHGNRNLTCIETGERSQQYKCKNNTAGTAKSYIFEKDEIHKAGRQCCNCDHDDYVSATVFFLKHGT